MFRVGDVVEGPGGVERTVTSIDADTGVGLAPLVWTEHGHGWDPSRLILLRRPVQSGTTDSASHGINYPKINTPPPMNCTRCNHRNEYLGWEHVSANGSYTCRSCK